LIQVKLAQRSCCYLSPVPLAEEVVVRMTGVMAFLDGIRARWESHQCSVAAQRELNACDPELAAEMARDLNLSTNDFKTVVANSAGSEQLLDGMMVAFHLDRARLREETPGALREAQITCARCSAKQRCSRELAVSTAAMNAVHFCPNANLFVMLTPHQFGDAGAGT
jgi:hypothetical protein